MKKIRLTETEFRSLIKRIVVEAQNEMYNDEIEEGMFGGFGDKLDDAVKGGMFGGIGDKVEDAIKGVADFFKNEVLSDLSDEDKMNLKRRISNVNIEREMEKVDNGEEDMLEEGIITEGIGDRLRSFFERLGIGSGLGISASGLLGLISNGAGWSESEILTNVHDIMQNAGIGNYGGPVSLLVIIAGIALALKSTSMRHNRMGK